MSSSLSSSSSSNRSIEDTSVDEEAQVVLSAEQSVEGIVKVVAEDAYLDMPQYFSAGYYFDGEVEVDDKGPRADECGKVEALREGRKEYRMLFNFTSDDPRVFDFDGLEGLLSVGAGEEVTPIPCRYESTDKSWQYVRRKSPSQYGFVPLAYLYPPYERVDPSTIQKPRREPSALGIPYAALPPSRKQSAKPARCSEKYIPQHRPPMSEAPKVLKVKHIAGIDGWVSVGSLEEAMRRASRTVEFVCLHQGKLETSTVGIDEIVWPEAEGGTRGSLPPKELFPVARKYGSSSRASTGSDHTHAVSSASAKYPKHRSGKIHGSESSSLSGTSDSSGHHSLEGSGSGRTSSRDTGVTYSGPRSHYSASDRSSLPTSTPFSHSHRQPVSALYSTSSTSAAPGMQSRHEHKKPEHGMKSYSSRRQSRQVLVIQKDESRALAHKASPLLQAEPQVHVHAARAPSISSSKPGSQPSEDVRRSSGVLPSRKALPVDKHSVKKAHVQPTGRHVVSESSGHEGASARRSALASVKPSLSHHVVVPESTGRSEAPTKRLAWDVEDDES